MRPCMMWLLWLAIILVTGCTQTPQYPKVFEFRYVAATGQQLSFLCLRVTRADAPLPGTYECDIGEWVR